MVRAASWLRLLGVHHQSTLPRHISRQFSRASRLPKQKTEDEIIEELNNQLGNPDVKMLTIRNAFLKINEPDPEQAARDFLEGAKHALITVSDLMAQERFNDLESMIERRLLGAVQHRFTQLSQQEKDFVRIDEGDIEFLTFYPPYVTHNIPSEKLLFSVVYKGENSRKLFNRANHFLASYIFERSLEKQASTDFFIGFLMLFRIGQRENVMIIP